MKESQITTRRNRATFIALMALIALATLLLMPSTATAANLTNDSGGTYAACAQGGNGAGNDWTNCLPSGRWSTSIGVIMTRNEAATGLLSTFQNLSSTIGTTMRLMMPNMFLSLAQTAWSAALGMSQFAASFTPLDAMGHTVDTASAKLVDGIMGGSLPAIFLVIGILGGFGALVFKSQQQGKTILRRTLVSLGCFTLILVMGGQAARSTDTTPATGSPWWTVRTINNAVNTLAVTVDLDGINDSSNMMSYSGGNGNCQSYLYQMRQQYLGKSGGSGAPSDQSNVVTAIDRLWQETALRSYVTMQWGNPQVGGASNSYVAANAQQAYCHVLEASSGTPISVQQSLTNSAMGTSINSATAKFLFSEKGWISPQDSVVNSVVDASTRKDSEESVKLDRMGVFWETCSASGGTAKARDGWSKLINNISDTGSGPIWGSGSKNMLRMGVGGKDGTDDGNNGKQWDRLAPKNPSRIMVADTDYSTAVSTLCSNVFGNKIWNNSADPSGKDDDISYVDTNLGDSAIMGWRFDVPNVGGVWREANMYNESADSVGGSVQTTLNYLYGTSSVDTTGAFSSVIGSIVNLIVWGLLSFVLILCKLMLTLMPLLLIAALFIQSIPVGEAWRSSLKNWFKFTINLSIMGIMYGIIASIATFICQIILKATASASGTLFYQFMAGLSPVFALLIIGIFCTKVLHVGNPFSIKAMLEIAGTGALAAGAMHMAGRGVHYAAMNRMFGRGRHKNGQPQGTRSRNGNGTESGQIAERAAAEQSNGVSGDEETTTPSTPTPIRAGDDPNLSDKAALEADAAQDDLIGMRNGQNRDREWFAGRSAAHHAAGEAAADWMSDESHRLHISEGAAKTIGAVGAGAADAGTLVTAPFRRRALREGMKRTARSAAKIGLATAGVAAIGATGGAALALPAGIMVAGVAARNGARKGLAYHRAAKAIAANLPQTRTTGTEGGTGSAPATGGAAVSPLTTPSPADEAAREQETVAMGVEPTTRPMAGATPDPTPVSAAPFHSPTTRGARPERPKRMEHQPKPAWDDDDPAGSRQRLAEWHQNERDIAYYESVDRKEQQ